MSRFPQSKSSRSLDASSRQLRSAISVARCLPFTARGKTGNEWVSKAFMNFNSDFTGTFVEFSDVQLIEQCSQFPPLPISQLYVYGYPLNELMGDVLPAVAYHAFVIVQLSDEKGYWCMEKDDRGIQIFFSIKWDRILKKDGFGDDRPDDLEQKVKDKCSSNIQEVFAWLCQSNQLSKPYHYTDRNCQHFAEEIFNYFASSQMYQP